MVTQPNHAQERSPESETAFRDSLINALGSVELGRFDTLLQSLEESPDDLRAYQVLRFGQIGGEMLYDFAAQEPRREFKKILPPLPAVSRENSATSSLLDGQSPVAASLSSPEPQSVQALPSPIPEERGNRRKFLQRVLVGGAAALASAAFFKRPFSSSDKNRKVESVDLHKVLAQFPSFPGTEVAIDRPPEGVPITEVMILITVDRHLADSDAVHQKIVDRVEDAFFGDVQQAEYTLSTLPEKANGANATETIVHVLKQYDPILYCANGSDAESVQSALIWTASQHSYPERVLSRRYDSNSSLGNRDKEERKTQELSDAARVMVEPLFGKETDFVLSRKNLAKLMYVPADPSTVSPHRVRRLIPSTDPDSSPDEQIAKIARGERFNELEPGSTVVAILTESGQIDHYRDLLSATRTEVPGLAIVTVKQTGGAGVNHLATAQRPTK